MHNYLSCAIKERRGRCVVTVPVVGCSVIVGRAPHTRGVCKICLSVGPYVHDTIIYKCYSNLRIPSIIDCSFEQYSAGSHKRPYD